MKKVMTLSICLLVTITSLASSFASNLSSNFDDRDKKEITLTLDDVKEGQLLSVKDVHGFVLYKKTFEKSGIVNNTFDFSALPDGTYFFEHEKAYQIKIIPFNVSFGEVTFDATGETIFYKPVVRIKDNHVYFSKLELAAENVDVTLYYLSPDNHEFKVLHKENFKDITNIQRVYSLSKKQSGNYKIVINANGRDYIENFTI
ncbi:hypothetical protein [Formosa sp. PL04]|uniref:hypothetical protein n=1 Tax=Formosa sp. PL04 TaxID=3081755 RepID=UPI002980C63D|nr:hypothetical protein [Formosa sp. PL04]MDW5289487.1 hypothetical protein [Formosa sp. PL04]